MIKVIVGAGYIAFAFCVYCCCRVASLADRWMKTHMPEGESGINGAEDRVE